MILRNYDLLWLSYLDAVGRRDGGILNFVNGLFISDKHDRGACLDELLCLGFRHIWSPVIGKDDTAIVHTEPRDEIILLEFHAKLIGDSEE